MSIGKQKDKEKFVGVSVKLEPDKAELLNAICNALGINTYQIFQMFFYTLCKATAPMHEMSPEIRKIMTLMESDYSWQETFNTANPDHLDVAQVVLILEQPGRKGYGAVLIDKPWLSMAPKWVKDLDPERYEPQMTENVEDILERILDVTVPGIYKRFRVLGGSRGYHNMIDIMLDMIDRQATDLEREVDRMEMQGEAMYDVRGRKIEYGKKTKGYKHRTPDSVAMDQRLPFADFDRDEKAEPLKDWEGEHHDTR